MIADVGTMLTKRRGSRFCQYSSTLRPCTRRDVLSNVDATPHTQAIILCIVCIVHTLETHGTHKQSHWMVCIVHTCETKSTATDSRCDCSHSGLHPRKHSLGQ